MFPIKFINTENKINNIIKCVSSFNSIILWVKNDNCHIAPVKSNGRIIFLASYGMAGIAYLKILKIKSLNNETTNTRTTNNKNTTFIDKSIALIAFPPFARYSTFL